VLAEFLSACIWIVIGAVPIDRLVFDDNFVLPLSRNRNRAYVTEAPQSVIVINLHSELDYLKRAAQVHIQAALLRFPVQRRGAMNNRVSGVDQSIIIIAR
jgi:hypothetical protein